MYSYTIYILISLPYVIYVKRCQLAGCLSVEFKYIKEHRARDTYSLVMLMLLLPNAGRIICGVSFLAVCGVAYTSDVTELDVGKKYAPVALVTVAWFLMFYTFLFHQSFIHNKAYFQLIKDTKKSGKGERIDKSRVKMGLYPGTTGVVDTNTVVRNTMEQSMTFIPLLWLCAALPGDEESVEYATKCAWFWVFTRAYYPVVLPLKGHMLFLSTMPGYLAQTLLALKIFKNATS